MFVKFAAVLRKLVPNFEVNNYTSEFLLRFFVTGGPTAEVKLFQNNRLIFRDRNSPACSYFALHFSQMDSYKKSPAASLVVQDSFHMYNFSSLFEFSGNT